MKLLTGVFIACLLSVGLSEESLAQEFTLSSVEAIAQDPQVKTLEDFLARIPSFMKSGSSFTLAYNPHGLLTGSLASPLTYLFGDKRSSVVLVFKAHPPSLPTEEEFMEILSFDNTAKKHSLAKITFPANGQPLVERHPRACVACHGPNEKPLWRSGYRWEGFFGSKLDDLNQNPAEKSAMAGLMANPGERLRDLDLSRAYGSGLRMGNNNISLNGRLAIEHSAAIVARIMASPAYREKSAALFYALSLCERDNTALLIKALEGFGITPDEWYLNREAKPDQGSPGYYSLPGQSFEIGMGPIEYLLLSQILAKDVKHPLRNHFKRFILRYAGASAGSLASVESSLKSISTEAPNAFVAPFTFDQSSTLPSQKWCRKFRAFAR